MDVEMKRAMHKKSLWKPREIVGGFVGPGARSSSCVVAHALAVVLLLASFSLGVPASAGDDPRGIVARGGGLGAGWMAIMIDSDGSDVNLALKTHDIKTPNALQIFMYNGEDKFLGGRGRLWTRAEKGVYVDAHPQGGPDITYQAADASGTDLWELSDEITSIKGITKLLVWSGGPQAGWSWTLRGGNAVRLVGLETGPGAHVIQSNDMSGLADARVHPVEIPTCPYVCINGAPGARASLERSKAVAFENTPIGFYLDMANEPPYSNNLLKIDTPFGEKLCLPGCTFAQYRSGWPKGFYRFRVDAGMGAGFPQSDEILAVAVDARLPALPSPVLVFNGETALSGAPGASAPVAVRLTDATGSPVLDADVTFQLRDGDSVTSATAVTGSDGVARVSMALPDRAGLWLLTATADATGLTVAPATMPIQTAPGV